MTPNAELKGTPLFAVISETIIDKAIVSVERQELVCAIYRLAPFPMILNDPQSTFLGFNASYTGCIKVVRISVRVKSTNVPVDCRQWSRRTGTNQRLNLHHQQVRCQSCTCHAAAIHRWLTSAR